MGGRFEVASEEEGWVGGLIEYKILYRVKDSKARGEGRTRGVHRVVKLMK